MTVLVTGASGFIGAAVVRRLLDAGERVRVLVRPTSDRTNLAGLAVEPTLVRTLEPCVPPGSNSGGAAKALCRQRGAEDRPGRCEAGGSRYGGPVTPAARFGGKGEVWLIHRLGRAHHPTVSGGRAAVMYLLPRGAISFTKR